MRTIKELLQVMLDNKHLFVTGLCGWACALYMDEYEIISKAEYDELENYINSKIPKHKNAGDFWWKIGSINPRLKWIEKHIKLNS
jgi:hypothetical protein